jgi:hypothetical protein
VKRARLVKRAGMSRLMWASDSATQCRIACARSRGHSMALDGEAMFKWLDASAAQAFGTELATFYMERVPFDPPFSQKKFAAKVQDVLGKMKLQIQKFRATHSLNFYQKAKLGNSFKWALRDGGYDTKYVDEITEWLIVHFQ